MIQAVRKSFTRLSAATLLLLLDLLVLPSFHPSTADCITNGSPMMTLVMQSRRNATGHHITKVSLQTRAMPGRRESDLGKVEASQSVRMCDGEEVIDTWATVTAFVPRLRPSGYELFPGLGYYKFHTKAVTWDEAYHTCERENSHLIVVNSEAEVNVVKQFFNRRSTVDGAYSDKWAWVGFHDRETEGDYRTVHGDRLNETGYTYWGEGRPNSQPLGDGPDADCGTISLRASFGDVPCLRKFAYICEQAL